MQCNVVGCTADLVERTLPETKATADVNLLCTVRPAQAPRPSVRGASCDLARATGNGGDGGWKGRRKIELEKKRDGKKKEKENSGGKLTLHRAYGTSSSP